MTIIENDFTKQNQVPNNELLKSRTHEEGIQKKKSKSIKLLLLILTLIVILFCMIYFGLNYYKQYKLRFLKEAEVKLNIDDREGAVTALKSHILNNPKDFDVQLKLSTLMVETGLTESAVRVLERLISNWEVRANNEDLYYQAILKLCNIINDSCKVIEERARIHGINEEYQLAIKKIDKAIELYRGNPIFSFIHINRMDTLKFSTLNLRNSITLLDYESVIAEKAKFAWLMGDIESIDLIIEYSGRFITTLSTNYDPKRVRRILSYKIEESAAEKFDKSKWKEAKEAYSYAKEQRLIALDNVYDEETCRIQYNEAISEYNRGNYWKAISLLKELKQKDSNYLKSDTDKILSQSQKNIKWNEYDKIAKDANDMFDDKDWIGAVAGYLKLADHLISSGYSKSSEVVCEAYYNVAMAYYNDKQYRKARDILKAITENNSNYENFRINEMIRKLDELVKYY